MLADRQRESGVRELVEYDAKTDKSICQVKRGEKQCLAKHLVLTVQAAAVYHSKARSTSNWWRFKYHNLMKTPCLFELDCRHPTLFWLRLQKDLISALASQAFTERIFFVCGWFTAGRHNWLSKNWWEYLSNLTADGWVHRAETRRVRCL